MEENVENTHTQEGTQPAAEQTAAPAAAQPSTETAAPLVSLKDADEATKLKTYNEMFGTAHKTLAEAFPPAKPSKEELEAQKDNKRKKAISWAIDQNKLTPEQIEKAVLAKNRNSRDIAKDIFALEMREEDSKLTDEDIEAQFQDAYHEDKEESDPRRKAAIKRMEKLAEGYRASATKEYDGVENEYDSAETTRERFGNYSTQVKALAKELPKELSFSLPYKSIDGTEFNLEAQFSIDDKTIEAVRKDFLNEGTYRAIGAHENEVKSEALQQEMATAIHARVFKEAVAHVASQMIEAAVKDTRAKLQNIPATGTSKFIAQPAVNTTKEAPKHTEFQKAMLRQRPAVA